MEEFIKIIEIRKIEEVNKFLNNGWVLIDKVETGSIYDNDKFTFCLGLPVRLQLKKLEVLLAAYEKVGLKEELFKKIAEKHNESINDYEFSTYLNAEYGELGKFMTDYYITREGKEGVFRLKGKEYGVEF